MSDAYLDSIVAALKANAESARKPIKVEVPKIGTLYVRPRLVEEWEAAEKSQREGDFNAICAGIAQLVCRENGERLPKEYQDKVAALLAKQPMSLVTEIGNAADGTKDASGN